MVFIYRIVSRVSSHLSSPFSEFWEIPDFLDIGLGQQPSIAVLSTYVLVRDT